jgi:hypothetical protein
MPETKPKRDRSGYVMVELNDTERAKLVKLQEKRNAKLGTRLGLAPIIRQLIMEAKN